jgi:potassium efflux system protein
VVTSIAAKNLPGVLEIGLLQRLPLQPGSRYAITTLSQYAITAVGITIALSALGARWSQIQWLVAALSVGLGFGLQEIVANFISGLILLFERPIRVGDTVTIGDLTGKVTRIRIRATTIVDWDNKEIVVPNKNFITERFVNWTLSDPVIRVKINVGIAYGSNVEEALKVMYAAANAQDKVLQEPAAQALFLGFGDSSLDFEIQIYIRDLSDRLPVIHGIHMAINDGFAKAEIEIPFPQRDLHVRSISVPESRLGKLVRD